MGRDFILYAYKKLHRVSHLMVLCLICLWSKLSRGSPVRRRFLFFLVLETKLILEADKTFKFLLIFSAVHNSQFNLRKNYQIQNKIFTFDRQH